MKLELVLGACCMSSAMLYGEGSEKLQPEQACGCALSTRRACICPDWLPLGLIQLPGRWIPAPAPLLTLPEAVGGMSSSGSGQRWGHLWLGECS